jgi:hypothetical protein
MSQTGTTTAAPTTTSFGTFILNVLDGLGADIFDVALAVSAVWFPQLSNLTTTDLSTIGNNFRLFLVAVQGGTPWGQALADMMTADWNTVADSAKMAAIDFASDVATALEAKGLIPAKGTT